MHLATLALLAGLTTTAPQAPQPQRHQAPPMADGEAAWRDLQATAARWRQQWPDLVSERAIGRSVQDRPLLLLRVGAQQDGAPEIYLGGGIHGHERSEDDARFLVETLLLRRDDAEVGELLRTRTLWVQLAVNPDGIVAHSRKNARGVDCNRNFGANWRGDERVTSTRYPGPEPFSEPETRAVRDFLLEREHLRAYLDLHRSARLLVPAARADGTIAPAEERAAGALCTAMGDYPRMGRNATSFHGVAVDWAGQELGVIAFTLESPMDPTDRGEGDPRTVLLHWLLRHAPDLPRCRRADAAAFAPQDVTAATRADAQELARLQEPGTVLFADGFESDGSLADYFDLGGADEGRIAIVQDATLAHSGRGALALSSTDSAGRSCGAHATRWLGDAGHDVVHLRWWIRYADDYDQGNLNHTGGSLSAIAGTDRWAAMGSAGLRPVGDDHFSVRVEGWVDWRKAPPPGWLMAYAYWMDMRRDRDGHFWGNLLGPRQAERFVPVRGRWLCVEQRVAANTPGAADGELAIWLDGALYLHLRGIRWRSSAAVTLRRATLMVYVHEARRDNRVWYDDVVASTGYVGTGPAATAPK